MSMNINQSAIITAVWIINNDEKEANATQPNELCDTDDNRHCHNSIMIFSSCWKSLTFIETQKKQWTSKKNTQLEKENHRLA